VPDTQLPFPHSVRRRGRRSGAVRIEVGARSAWLYGVGMAGVCDELGIPRMRDWHPGRKGTLMCPVNRVDDVLAVLEHREGRTVDLSAVDR
jgi:hypothetical protein